LNFQFGHRQLVTQGANMPNALAQVSILSPRSYLTNFAKGLVGLCRNLLVLSAILLLMGLRHTQTALAQISQQDRAAIAQTREMAIQAINTRDFSKIAPYLHPSFTITTVDNRVFHTGQEFEQYWNDQFTGPIKNIAMDVKVDDSRTFLSSETEVAYGDAIATFSFTDGNEATMPMRWTAVVQKFQNKWTLQALHFSSNLLDNPVLSAAQRLGRTIAIASGVGGFLLGAIVILLLRRKSQEPIEKAS
jgi:ketosteroid isomerase-like protein